MRGVFKRTYNRQTIIVVVADKSGEKYWFNPPTLLYILFLYLIYYIFIFSLRFSLQNKSNKYNNLLINVGKCREMRNIGKNHKKD
jgi:hypothetical protein